MACVASPYQASKRTKESWRCLRHSEDQFHRSSGVRHLVGLVSYGIAERWSGFRCSMAAFDDSTDPELGAACNRLAAWVEPLPAGATIDDRSGLTQQDLALILRHIHATRLDGASDTSDADEAPRPSSRPSVPITVRD